jgi:hypothetical protein
MEPNPRIPSRLGCGGLLLLILGMIHVPFLGVPFVAGMRAGGLVMDKEHYLTGEIWWLVGPLGVLSVIAVFRLAYGHRDWLAPAVAAAWLVIAAGYAVATEQFAFVTLMGLILILIWSGTWTDRRDRDAS